MWQRFNQWLDALPDRTIDRISQMVLIALFWLVVLVLGALIVAYR